MTRQKIVDICTACLGTVEGDARHQTIIDIYNNYNGPGKRSYKIINTDPWCAAFVSAVFIASGEPDLIPIECSCLYMKNYGINRGMLRDPKRYVPRPGDIIFYKWKGKHIVTHVGIVKSVKGSELQVFEGNYNNRVGIRNIKLSYQYIDSYLEVKYDG